MYKMRMILVILFSCFCYTAYSGAHDTLTDVYKGILSTKTGKGLVTELRLSHEPYADEGTFVLIEKYAGYPNAGVLKGQWTVLRGSATDKNAVVIELYNGTGVPERHYLKLKNGTIKMLDEKLMPIKGKGNYILQKR
ncbi:MAG: hypothetical protein BGO69_00010 [Bacteroidetes bacterium 46-16]|nr:MAG: hypothetical protein BGO69_00010 [Bacteroidetes bacterium 46-16]